MSETTRNDVAAGDADGLAYAVTLIHGTYAAGAPWVEAGSAMRLALEASEGAPCLFGSFGWSGDNNLFARILATHELIAHLRAIHLKHPGIKHILIAHSHGGNIALQAAHHGRGIGSVAGICCLATPFFHARLRGESDLSGGVLQAIVFASFSLPYLVASLWWPVFRPWSLLFWAVAYVISAAVSGFLAGGIGALRPAAANIVDWSHARSVTRLKILRASGDEASLVLSVGQLSAWAAGRAVTRFARAEEADPHYLVVRRPRLSAGLRNAAIVIAVAAAIGTALAATGQLSAPWMPRFIGVEVALGLIVLAFKTRLLDRYLFGFAALGFILSMLLNRTLIGTSIPRALRAEGGLGRWPMPSITAALLALMIDLKTESTPEGGWPIEMLPPRVDAPAELLTHSLYEHPVAISRVAAWLQQIRSEDGGTTRIGPAAQA